MKYLLAIAALLGSTQAFAQGIDEGAPYQDQAASCSEGKTVTGWICSGYSGRHEEQFVPVLLVCRSGQWVYDPAMNGGFVSPPSCNQ